MTHVLVVDDDRTTTRLLAMLLELEGFQVSQTPQAEAVLEMGRKKNVDAFVIDCNLGEVSGVDLLRHIRADADLADKRVIMTSGLDLSHEAMGAGADLFLLKPFSPTELSEKLGALLE